MITRVLPLLLRARDLSPIGQLLCIQLEVGRVTKVLSVERVGDRVLMFEPASQKEAMKAQRKKRTPNLINLRLELGRS